MKIKKQLEIGISKISPFDLFLKRAYSEAENEEERNIISEKAVEIRNDGFDLTIDPY